MTGRTGLIATYYYIVRCCLVSYYDQRKGNSFVKAVPGKRIMEVNMNVLSCCTSAALSIHVLYFYNS